MPEVDSAVSNWTLSFIFETLGYARLHENVTAGKADNHEGLDFYRPVETPDKTKPLWGVNQWPSVVDFREKFEEWIQKMKALGLIVMEAYVFLSCKWMETEELTYPEIEWVQD